MLRADSLMLLALVGPHSRARASIPLARHDLFCVMLRVSAVSKNVWQGYWSDRSHTLWKQWWRRGSGHELESLMQLNCADFVGPWRFRVSFRVRVYNFLFLVIPADSISCLHLTCVTVGLKWKKTQYPVPLKPTLVLLLIPSKSNVSLSLSLFLFFVTSPPLTTFYYCTWMKKLWSLNFSN